MTPRGEPRGVIETTDVQGYALALDRLYDPRRHLWVEVLDGRARIGMDPLGVETSGDLVQLALEPVGSVLRRSQPFGSIEAAKFVGPLELPLSGLIVRVNEQALADPGLVQRDPFGDGWLVEIEPADPAEFDLLLAGAEQIVPWFEQKIEEYKLKGMIAE